MDHRRFDRRYSIFNQYRPKRNLHSNKKKWCERDALQALDAEKRLGIHSEHDSAVEITFPQNTRTEDRSKTLHPAIQNMYFHTSAETDKCIAVLEPNASVAQLINMMDEVQIDKQGLVTKTFTTERKTPITHKEIDPYTLSITNILDKSVESRLREIFRSATRIKVSRSSSHLGIQAFAKYSNVQLAIEALYYVHDEHKYLHVKFRRIIPIDYEEQETQFMNTVLAENDHSIYNNAVSVMPGQPHYYYPNYGSQNYTHNVCTNTSQFLPISLCSETYNLQFPINTSVNNPQLPQSDVQITNYNHQINPPFHNVSTSSFTIPQTQSYTCSIRGNGNTLTTFTYGTTTITHPNFPNRAFLQNPTNSSSQLSGQASIAPVTSTITKSSSQTCGLNKTVNVNNQTNENRISLRPRRRCSTNTAITQTATVSATVQQRKNNVVVVGVNVLPSCNINPEPNTGSAPENISAQIPISSVSKKGRGANRVKKKKVRKPAGKRARAAVSTTNATKPVISQIFVNSSVSAPDTREQDPVPCINAQPSCKNTGPNSSSAVGTTFALNRKTSTSKKGGATSRVNKETVFEAGSNRVKVIVTVSQLAGKNIIPEAGNQEPHSDIRAPSSSNENLKLDSGSAPDNSTSTVNLACAIPKKGCTSNHAKKGAVRKLAAKHAKPTVPATNSTAAKEPVENRLPIQPEEIVATVSGNVAPLTATTALDDPEETFVLCRPKRVYTNRVSKTVPNPSKSITSNTVQTTADKLSDTSSTVQTTTDKSSDTHFAALPETYHSIITENPTHTCVENMNLTTTSSAVTGENLRRLEALNEPSLTNFREQSSCEDQQNKGLQKDVILQKGIRSLLKKTPEPSNTVQDNFILNCNTFLAPQAEKNKIPVPSDSSDKIECGNLTTLQSSGTKDIRPKRTKSRIIHSPDKFINSKYFNPPLQKRNQISKSKKTSSEHGLEITTNELTKSTALPSLSVSSELLTEILVNPSPIKDTSHQKKQSQILRNNVPSKKTSPINLRNSTLTKKPTFPKDNYRTPDSEICARKRRVQQTEIGRNKKQRLAKQQAMQRTNYTTQKNQLCQAITSESLHGSAGSEEKSKEVDAKQPSQNTNYSILTTEICEPKRREEEEVKTTHDMKKKPTKKPNVHIISCSTPSTPYKICLNSLEIVRQNLNEFEDVQIKEKKEDNENHEEFFVHNLRQNKTPFTKTISLESLHGSATSEEKQIEVVDADSKVVKENMLQDNRSLSAPFCRNITLRVQSNSAARNQVVYKDSRIMNEYTSSEDAFLLALINEDAKANVNAAQEETTRSEIMIENVNSIAGEETQNLEKSNFELENANQQQKDAESSNLVASNAKKPHENAKRSDSPQKYTTSLTMCVLNPLKCLEEVIRTTSLFPSNVSSKKETSLVSPSVKKPHENTEMSNANPPQKNATSLSICSLLNPLKCVEEFLRVASFVPSDVSSNGESSSSSNNATQTSTCSTYTGNLTDSCSGPRKETTRNEKNVSCEDQLQQIEEDDSSSECRHRDSFNKVSKTEVTKHLPQKYTKFFHCDCIFKYIFEVALDKIRQHTEGSASTSQKENVVEENVVQENSEADNIREEQFSFVIKTEKTWETDVSLATHKKLTGYTATAFFYINEDEISDSEDSSEMDIDDTFPAFTESDSDW